MEPLAKSNRDPLPSTLISKHLHSTIWALLLIFFFIILEAFFVLQGWIPISSHFVTLTFSILVLIISKPYLWKPSPIYLVDFSCFKPPNQCKVPFSTFLEHVSMMDCFTKESVAFMGKILTSSGQSEETYLPPALHYIPPKTHQRESLKEVQMVLFPIIEDLLSKTKVAPSQIDILIVNCSGFCPSPSLSSMVIKEYSMKTDIKNYNLSGMGCSAGTIGINLAQNLLKVHNNSYALVLSAEILSTGWYNGNEKPKLLLNCLFRMGSSAVLLTNKIEARRSSKYKLFATVRTQAASEDKAYLSAFREEDSNGKLGVNLGSDILQVLGESLKTNVTILGSQILPPLEKIKHSFSILTSRFIDKSREVYVPDFKSVVQHFCLPTSGRHVIREMAKGLKLGEREFEAAFVTLHRFGNQSSASLWYELAYLEAKERVRKGDKVWQLGMGSGLKYCSVAWECLRPIAGESNKGPWEGCAHLYPPRAFE